MKLSPTERRILILALASRLVVLFLMTIADATFPDLDSSAHLQTLNCDGSLPQHSKSTPLIGLSPWDSVYFLHIAKCGYHTDMINAFFPLLPFIMRYTSKYSGIESILSVLSLPIESGYVAIGLLVNIIAFGFAALALFRLSKQVFPKEESLATIAVVFFCFNPASVFYSAVYTESLFAALSWWGLVFLSKNYPVAVLLFSLAGAARSNGILLAWFLIHTMLSECAKKKRLLWKSILKCVICCGVVWLPYIAMQVYGYRTYCHRSNINSKIPLWCSKAVPSVYSFVQDTYWDVGLLRFYRHADRWPWLLQSAPVLYLSISACLKWVSADWQRAFSLGLSPSSKLKSRKTMGGFSSTILAPFIYYLAGMTAMAALLMHVNVATRFLSSSPALYWFVALKMKDPVVQKWIWLWSLAFIILGCLLFPNFYPWT